MVVKHVVLVSLKPEVPSSKIAGLADTLHGLSAIPGVLSVDFGETFTKERNQGYTHALIVELKDRKALQVYIAHKLHVDSLKNDILPIVAPGRFLVIDIEDPAPARARL